MTTTMAFNPEELKRKFDDESQQGGPIQKLLKTSSEELSDIFNQSQFSLSLDEDEEDDFDMNSELNDIINEDPTNQQLQQQQQEQQPDQQQQEGQKQQQPAPPQRKKPGRKPNPASPALRKAQNRAAQRAFRERKERHLRELENTIKTLRESLVEHQREITHYQRESARYRSLIEQLESEVSFLKQVAFTFECALNNIHGNNDATTNLKNNVNVVLNGGGNGIVGSMNPFSLGTAQMRPMVTLPSQQQQQQQQHVPTAQQIQNSFLNLLNVNDRVPISSPATSTVMTSPNGSVNISTASVSAASSPPTPEPIISDPSTFFTEEFAREITLADMKPFVNNLPPTSIPLFADGNGNSFNSSVGPQIMSKSNSNNNVILNKNNNGICASSSFIAEAASMIDNEADFFSNFILNDELGSYEEGPKQLLTNVDSNNSNDNEIKIRDQIIRLSKKVGQAYPSRIFPKTRYPLTRQQEYYLSLDHDPRIDMIPCLHLRSRMIEYRDQYDLYELVELLINEAKCHGDPIDPDSWELPEVFFERYAMLSLQHCRIKSTLYKKFGYLPKDFAKFYGKGLHLIS